MNQHEDRAAQPLTPATFHILLSLSQGVAHGYAVKRMVEERTNGAVLLGAGTLYAAIKRMTTDGLIEETAAPQEAGEAEAGTRWRFYAITPLGRDVLGCEIERLEAELAAARAIIPKHA